MHFTKQFPKNMKSDLVNYLYNVYLIALVPETNSCNLNQIY